MYIQYTYAHQLEPKSPSRVPQRPATYERIPVSWSQRVPPKFLKSTHLKVGTARRKGIKAIFQLKPIFTTLHISGGDDMQKVSNISKNKITKVLGVTILTSMNNKQTLKYYNDKNVKAVARLECPLLILAVLLLLHIDCIYTLYQMSTACSNCSIAFTYRMRVYSLY